MKFILIALAFVGTSAFAQTSEPARESHQKNEDVPYFPAGACDSTFESYSEARSFCAEYETGVWRIRTSNGYAYTCECGGPRQ